MITYNDIYEVVRKERYSEQLQSLPKNFIFEVAEYLKEKKEIASKESEDFSDVVMKTKKQLENAKILFKELILRRRRKILNLVLIASETGISKQDYENMLDFEKELFDELVKKIELCDKNLNLALNGEKKEEENQLVVFKEDIKEIINFNGEKMSFEKGQIANIPREIAKILIDEGKAEKIEE